MKYANLLHSDTETVDDFASALHESWSHWTKYMLSHLTEENIVRWKRQIAMPYSALSEEEKESDRVVARILLKTLSQK